MILTRAQRESLLRMWERSPQEGMSYREWRRTAQLMIFGDGAIIIQWSGMYLAIETDGYTHT